MSRCPTASTTCTCGWTPTPRATASGSSSASKTKSPARSGSTSTASKKHTPSSKEECDPTSAAERTTKAGIPVEKTSGTVASPPPSQDPKGTGNPLSFPSDSTLPTLTTKSSLPPAFLTPLLTSKDNWSSTGNYPSATSTCCSRLILSGSLSADSTSFRCQ